MKLKQLNGLTSFACLISNCHGYGNYIGQLSKEMFEEYQNCKVIKIDSDIYRRYGIEIWIEVTPRLQNKLCKNCGWTSCDNNPEYIEPSLEFEN